MAQKVVKGIYTFTFWSKLDHFGQNPGFEIGSIIIMTNHDDCKVALHYTIIPKSLLPLLPSLGVITTVPFLRRLGTTNLPEQSSAPALPAQNRVQSIQYL